MLLLSLLCRIAPFFTFRYTMCPDLVCMLDASSVTRRTWHSILRSIVRSFYTRLPGIFRGRVCLSVRPFVIHFRTIEHRVFQKRCLQMICRILRKFPRPPPYKNLQPLFFHEIFKNITLNTMKPRNNRCQ